MQAGISGRTNFNLNFTEFVCFLFLYASKRFLVHPFSEHTQDKHIQRDDEYYEGDHDNDHNMEDV